jgi:hypothetical protein
MNKTKPKGRVNITKYLVYVIMTSSAEHVFGLALVSSEGKMFLVSAEETRVSAYVTTLLQDMLPSELDIPIPLPTIPAKYLAIIVEYLKQNVSEPFVRIRKPIWRGDLGRSFVPNWVNILLEPLADEELLELHDAAGIMQIFMLEMVTAALVAWRWKMLSEIECLTKAGLCRSLTAEEEDCIRTENAWAFEETETEILCDPLFANIPHENVLGLK